MFSHKIWAELLKTKSSAEVGKAFDKIFEDANVTPEKLEVDQGSEFKGLKPYFKRKKIYYKIKIGAQKASFAGMVIF